MLYYLCSLLQSLMLVNNKKYVCDLLLQKYTYLINALTS
jgi:hypothetical protein